ncbi:hypothetical protein N657DRAFT_1871 [Parathielavia appendiculata]|uniref:Uncharacterized protein n=1 Tax=Parathielavia appendiculata TaxID=2587402 RepID=A0AAN6U8Q7_9PEZI|nr:hypothetical protein N657DRAFT_1871 [Parathielavia appendiculata]
MLNKSLKGKVFRQPYQRVQTLIPTTNVIKLRRPHLPRLSSVLICISITILNRKKAKRTHDTTSSPSSLLNNQPRSSESRSPLSQEAQ